MIMETENKDIKKAELLAINIKVINNEEVKIEIIFGEIARWVSKELLKIEISIEEWLKFLENCFIQFDNPEHIIDSLFLSVKHENSQTKIIGQNAYAFAVPKNKWKRFIEEQAEKLLKEGIITI